MEWIAGLLAVLVGVLGTLFAKAKGDTDTARDDARRATRDAAMAEQDAATAGERADEAETKIEVDREDLNALTTNTDRMLDDLAGDLAGGRDKPGLPAGGGGPPVAAGARAAGRGPGSIVADRDTPGGLGRVGSDRGVDTPDPVPGADRARAQGGTPRGEMEGDARRAVGGAPGDPTAGADDSDPVVRLPGDLGAGGRSGGSGRDSDGGGLRLLTLAEAGIRAIEVAESAWSDLIVEPPRRGKLDAKDQRDASIIDDYIRGPLGLRWRSVEVGPDARPDIPYLHNGDFAWCGAFAAWCWAHAGLDAKARKYNWSSTSRLHSWARYKGRKEPKGLRKLHGAQTRSFQQVSTKEFPLHDVFWVPEPGDICLVGRASSKAHGNHVTLVRAFDEHAGEILTIEGNARGQQPDGGKREGVIRRRRPLPRPGLSDKTYRVRAIIRPSALDLRPV